MFPPPDMVSYGSQSFIDRYVIAHERKKSECLASRTVGAIGHPFVGYVSLLNRDGYARCPQWSEYGQVGVIWITLSL